MNLVNQEHIMRAVRELSDFSVSMVFPAWISVGGKSEVGEGAKSKKFPSKKVVKMSNTR